MEARIGIFICDCGKSLKNIDFPWLQGRAASLPNVVYANLCSDLCLREGLEAMLSAIKEQSLNRVVIAACSPEVKGQILRSAVEQVGLDSNMISWANLREQCSWAHNGDVTPKALSLIKMAVSESQFLEPLKKEEIPVNQRALIIGGGFSGLKVALELSQLGVKTTLVEKQANLGGRLRETDSIYGLESTPREILNSLLEYIVDNESIEVMTSAEVARVDGTVGDFRVEIRRNGGKILRNFGAIVLASGYQTEAPTELKPGNIISPSEFFRLSQQPEQIPKKVAFLLDVFDEHSRLPTLSALNSALMVKERLGNDVYVFAKNLKIDSEGAERLYREAREKGVVFLKFEERPRVFCEDGQVRIEVKDILLREDVMLYCDLLVTEEKALPSKELASILNIGTDSRGFYQEVNPHLFQVLSNRKGVFFAGSCRADIDLGRASIDAIDAAYKVYELLSRDRVEVAVEKVWVDPDKCRACLTCLRVCPHRAIGMERVESGKESARIYDFACDGCGICAAICPAKAIKYEGYSDEQILAKIEAIEVS